MRHCLDVYAQHMEVMHIPIHWEGMNDWDSLWTQEVALTLIHSYPAQSSQMESDLYQQLDVMDMLNNLNLVDNSLKTEPIHQNLPWHTNYYMELRAPQYHRVRKPQFCFLQTFHCRRNIGLDWWVFAHHFASNMIISSRLMLQL